MESREQDSTLSAKISDVKELLQSQQFAGYDRKVPKMEKVAKMPKAKLYVKLTQVPSSAFYGCNPGEIEDVLTYGVAVQYFALLSMFNERDKSDLPFVEEAGSSQEESKISANDECSLEMAVSSVASLSSESQSDINNEQNQSSVPSFEESKQAIRNLVSERFQRNGDILERPHQAREVNFQSQISDQRNQVSLSIEESRPSSSSVDRESESVSAGSIADSADSLDDRVIPDEEYDQPNAHQEQNEPDHDPRQVYTMRMLRVTIQKQRQKIQINGDESQQLDLKQRKRQVQLTKNQHDVKRLKQNLLRRNQLTKFIMIQTSDFQYNDLLYTHTPTECNDHFLNYKPSQIAAASLLLAINLSSSSIVADTFGFKKFAYPEVLAEQKLHPTDPASGDQAATLNNPLRLWREEIKQLTLLSASRDIQDVYTKLIQTINQAEFSDALYADPTLFMVDYQKSIFKK